MTQREIDLEHELAAALRKIDDECGLLQLCKQENEEKRKDIVYLATEKAQLENRIKQLEEMYEGEIGENPDLLGSNVMGLLKRELNAAQSRIKRLEEALDTLTLVVGLTPISGNKDALQEAIDVARSEIKAKEAKP